MEMSSDSGGHPGPGRTGFPARLQAVLGHTHTHTHTPTLLHTHTHTPTLLHTHTRSTLTHTGGWGGSEQGALPALSAPAPWRGLVWLGVGRNPEGNHWRPGGGSWSCRCLAVWEKGIQEGEGDGAGPSKGSLLGQAPGDAGERRLSPLLHSPQPHSWGQSPGQRKPGEHPGVPCVLGRH